MTIKELNRDIKRLLKTVSQLPTEPTAEYYNKLENVVKPEFRRLYLADRKFEAMNKQSILIMLRLNVRYRIEPLHTFGLFIDLPGVDC